MKQVMKMVKYPAHGDDFFTVTSEKGLELMKALCDKHGQTGVANCWVFPDGLGIKETDEYKAFLAENIQVYKDLCARYKDNPLLLADIPMDLLYMSKEPAMTTDEAYLLGGIDLGTEGMESWRIAAVIDILGEMDIKVRCVDYGEQEHMYWLSFVGD